MKDIHACNHCSYISRQQEINPCFVTTSLSCREHPVNIRVEDTEIFFLLKGKLILSYGTHSDNMLSSGEFVLIPPSGSVQVKVEEDAHWISFSYRPQMPFCENFRLDSLLPFCPKDESQFHSLPIHERIRDFLSSLEIFLTNGVSCPHFYGIKEKELLFFLRTYYSEMQLAAFFFPILNKETLFKVFILKNYLSVSSIAELADLMNYSISGFQKKFERVFGLTAFEWMNNQKSLLIIRDLRENDKSIKEIAVSYRFSSLPRFYEFCYRRFGKTPAEIRKNR